MRPSPILLKAIRRLPLTTKQGGKDYYKGTGTGSMGRHTKKGQYVIDYGKVRTYVVPDLTGFEMKAFVSKRIEPLRETFHLTETKTPSDGKDLIQQWKEEGGID